MLTPKGRIWSETTIARLSDDRFLLCGPTLAVDRDFDWLRTHVPPEGVALTKGFHRDGALLVMGPDARAVLSGLTDANLGADAAPWMSVAEIQIAGVAATALRLSYVGELGWELHVSSSDLPRLYDSIWQGGQDHGICAFGSYALNAMRIEKGYHGWGTDFGTEYTLFDAGLSGFANLKKGDFIGRDAVVAQCAQSPEWEFIGLEITDLGPDPLASDPILMGDALIGYVTSSSLGFRTGKHLALGYVKAGVLPMGTACHVQAFGELRSAIRHSIHVYDPDNARLKS